MNWKAKFYLIYPRKLVNEIKWPAEWGHQCSGNLADMLQEVLKIKSGIGSEIKLIWNDEHRRQLIKDYDITYRDLEDYIGADCSLLSFKSESLMNKTVKRLKEMGAE